MARLDCTGVTAVPIRSDSTYSLIRMGRSTVSRPSLTLVSALFLFLVLTSAGLAADIYVAQNAAGGDTGGDCTNAHSAAWFNTAGNWGTMPGQIGPGTTVHLCGTFAAASPNTTMLTVQGSGANGSPITILFEANAQLTSPAWSVNGAININAKSYITIDGGTNGLIQNTDNGSVLTYQQISHLVYEPSVGGVVHDIEIRNLTLTNTYIHVVNTTSDEYTVDMTGAVIIASAGSNILIHNNTATNCGGGCIGIAGGSSNATNWQIYSNTVKQAKWLINANNTTSQTHYIYIHDNDISDTDQYWNSDNAFHCNGIFIYGNASAAPGTYGYAYIYNNYIHGAIGNPNQTGYVFLSKIADGPSYIFNNVFRPESMSGAYCVGDGFIALQWDQIQGVYVYNNTFDGQVTCGYPTGNGTRVSITNAAPLDFRNNIVWQNGGFDVGTSGTVASSDYNVWYGIANAAQQAFKIDPSSYYYYSAAEGTPNWQGLGYDTHSTASSADPKLDSSDHLQSGSSAIGAGTNLTSLCDSDSNLAPLCSDKAGRPRPASGAWDAGAYNSSTGTALQPPTNLRVTGIN